MNQKLQTTLLALGKKSLSEIQGELLKLDTKTFTPKETQIFNATKSSKIITSIFKVLFQVLPKENQSNQLIKQIFVAQAALPADQREADFYTFIYNCSQQYGWDEANKNWLSGVLINLDLPTLTTLINQTSAEEFNFLFSCLKENQSLQEFQAWLENLSDNVWDVLLTKLSPDELREIDLLEITKNSYFAAKSFANYLIHADPNQKELWAFVKEKQLLTSTLLLDGLSGEVKDQDSNNFDEFFAKFTAHKKDPNELWSNAFQPLLDPPTDSLIARFSLRQQMIAYAFLGVYVGQLELNAKDKNPSEAMQQNLEIAKKTLNGYNNNSPFLAALYKAQVFPQKLFNEYIRLHLSLSPVDIKGYLELAGCLPVSDYTQKLINKLMSPRSTSSVRTSTFMESYQSVDDKELAAALKRSLHLETSVSGITDSDKSNYDSYENSDNDTTLDAAIAASLEENDRQKLLNQGYSTTTTITHSISTLNNAFNSTKDHEDLELDLAIATLLQEEEVNAPSHFFDPSKEKPSKKLTRKGASEEQSSYQPLLSPPPPSRYLRFKPIDSIDNSNAGDNSNASNNTTLPNKRGNGSINNSNDSNNTTLPYKRGNGGRGCNLS